jgi:hypothetical protein
MGSHRISIDDYTTSPHFIPLWRNDIKPRLPCQEKYEGDVQRSAISVQMEEDSIPLIADC